LPEFVVLNRLLIRWSGALALGVTLLAAPPAHADTTLVMLRHGEKPAAGLGQLDCQGLNRALALPDALLAKFARPAALFAPDPGVSAKDRGTLYNYVRPLATIEPTAIRLGMPVDTRWGLTSLAPLTDELLAPAHANQTLYIAWEHNLIVQLARGLMTRHGADPAQVPDWADDDFDSLYVITLKGAGGASFRVEHEGLNGQSTRCPGAAH
jgi:hypothetical protein